MIENINNQRKLIAQDVSILGCNAAIISQNNELYIGRNIDVPFTDGFLVVNQRNIKKTAYIPFDDHDNPISWVSRYGSVTANVFHLDMPLGGLNEKGLLVEHLALPGSVFPKKDDRKAVTPFEWIQYQLDNHLTVDEVIESENFLRINPWIFDFLHFLICDAQGNMAIIEYQKDKDGKSQRLVYRHKDFPEYFWALGNASYAEHIDFMKQYKGFGGTADVPIEHDVIIEDTKYQFASCANMLKHFNPEHHEPEAYVVEAMDKVNKKDLTQVTIAYQPSKGLMKFKTSNNLRMRTIDVNQIDFSPDVPRKALFWHDEPNINNWKTNLGLTSSLMLSHFAEHFWLDTFDPYKNDLKQYLAENMYPYADMEA